MRFEAAMRDLEKALGKKIRQQRKAIGLSQEALALLCKIDRSYMGRIERGEVSITIEKLFQISECLECAPACLLPPTQEAESGNLPPAS